MTPLGLMLVLVSVAVGGSIIIVLILDRILAFSLKKKITAFNDNYKIISLGMSKQQVIDIMGEKYTKSAATDIEMLCWSCHTNTAIQRELYSKKEAKKIIIVEFSNNKVVSYTMQ